MPAQEIERAAARRRRGFRHIRRTHVVRESVAGIVEMNLGRGECLANGLDRLRRRVRVLGPEVEEKGALRF